MPTNNGLRAKLASRDDIFRPSISVVVASVAETTRATPRVIIDVGVADALALDA